MNMNINPRFLLVTILPCFLCANPRPTSDRSLSLSLAPTEQTVKAGAEIKVITKLTNVTNHVVTLSDTQFDCDYLTEVRDNKGNPAPETLYKQRLRCNERLNNSRNILLTLR